jgi:hypothetical protein
MFPLLILVRNIREIVVLMDRNNGILEFGGIDSLMKFSQRDPIKGTSLEQAASVNV